MSKAVLYGYWRSSCTWRLRIALNLKEVPYDYKVIDLINTEANTHPEFVRLNPAKKVPVLAIDNNVLTESMAIIEYLDETRRNRPLFPNDPAARAKIRAIALHVTAGIQPLQNIRLIKARDAEEPGSGIKWANRWLNVGLKELDELVLKTAGKCCYGDEVTFADLFIPSILFNARRYGVDTSQFPVLTKIDEGLSLIEEFRAAAADNQPDAPLE